MLLIEDFAKEYYAANGVARVDSAEDVGYGNTWLQFSEG
jgi:hypothetical protein